MEKLFALKAHLVATRLFNPEKVEATAENGEAAFSGSESGPDLLLYRHSYTGVIDLAGIAGDIRDLLAQVLVWLCENGDPEHDRLTDWEGEPVDRGRSEVTLRFAFEEEVHYVPAPPGYAGKDKITYRGIEWQRTSAVADRALTLDGNTVNVSTGP